MLLREFSVLSTGDRSCLSLPLSVLMGDDLPLTDRGDGVLVIMGDDLPLTDSCDQGPGHGVVGNDVFDS